MNGKHTMPSRLIELEHEVNAANVEIERLRESNFQLREGAEEQKQRIRLLIAERDTARMQSDQKHSLREEFRELLGTDDIEQGVAVVRDLKQLAEVRLGYIKQLETEKEASNDMFKKLNIHALNLTDHINRLEEAGDYLCAAAAFLGWHDKIESWRKSKEAKP